MLRWNLHWIVYKYCYKRCRISCYKRDTNESTTSHFDPRWLLLSLFIKQCSNSISKPWFSFPFSSTKHYFFVTSVNPYAFHDVNWWLIYSLKLNQNKTKNSLRSRCGGLSSHQQQVMSWCWHKPRCYFRLATGCCSRDNSNISAIFHPKSFEKISFSLSKKLYQKNKKRFIKVQIYLI